MNNSILSLIFLVIGIFFRYQASLLPQGTVEMMGSGYFPSLVSTLLIVVAGIILIKEIFWKS